jgi:hypothetical protein
MIVQHDRIQPLADCGSVRQLLHGAVPAHRRKGSADGRVLVQEEGRIDARTEAGGLTIRDGA